MTQEQRDKALHLARQISMHAIMWQDPTAFWLVRDGNKFDSLHPLAIENIARLAVEQATELEELRSRLRDYEPPVESIPVDENDAPIMLGDYVLVTRWEDRSWYDPMAIGFVAEIKQCAGTMYRVANEDGSPILGVGNRWWCNAWHITPEQASNILATSRDKGQLVGQRPAY